MTFAEEIERAAKGETIEAITLASTGWERSDEDRYSARRKAPSKFGELLSWDEARPMLDYDYARGFGGEDCDAIWAWTESRVIFVHEYDGATSVNWLPRHPQVGSPSMSGEYSDE